ncbi:translocation protein TolB [Heyndrickxia sp. NPDC080065]|uniref:translocation protein TolB n=1 Tax=Heyndrickxia sp. NPDC080065 TaxID=3390568 RepID=UPI003D012CB4
MKKVLIYVLILFFCIQHSSIVTAESSYDVKAAIIKNDDLWIKTKDKETRITKGKYVRFPKWSFDGTWIAYIRGSSKDQFTLRSGELWLYSVKTMRHFKVDTYVMTNFQWAPNQNSIGFQTDKGLNIIDVRSLNQPHTIAPGIIDFSWLPDGSGILTSSKAGKSVFSDIVLNKIFFYHNKNQYKPHHFYTIPVGKDENFYGTSKFKWSHDQRWIAFQLVPTASLSADSNTLSVLSDDGRNFRKLNEMLNYEDWFQWAPSFNNLGYIKGSNRVAIENKGLNVAEIDKKITIKYTPRGYVDRDLIWQNDHFIFVSRSLKSKWVDVEQRPMPSLYKINIKTKHTKKITSPSSKEGDFYPQYINKENQLIWIRTNREKANVWIADPNGLNQKIWIENINLGTWYYEHWNWEEVFSLFQP